VWLFSGREFYEGLKKFGFLEYTGINLLLHAQQGGLFELQGDKSERYPNHQRANKKISGEYQRSPRTTGRFRSRATESFRGQRFSKKPGRSQSHFFFPL